MNFIKRGDLNSNKILAQQYSIAMKIGDIYNPEVKKSEISRKNTIFPSPILFINYIVLLKMILKEIQKNKSKNILIKIYLKYFFYQWIK